MSNKIMPLASSSTDNGVSYNESFLNGSGVSHLWGKVLAAIASGNITVDGATIRVGENGNIHVVLDPSFLAVGENGVTLSEDLLKTINDIKDNVADLETKLTEVYHYKGSVATTEDLASKTGMQVGDVYNVTENDMNYGWTGTEWDPLGGVFTVEALTDAQIDSIIGSVS